MPKKKETVIPPSKKALKDAATRLLEGIHPVQGFWGSRAPQRNRELNEESNATHVA